MEIEIKPSEKASDSIVSFAQRLLGPVAEAADFLSDKIRFMRWRSAQKTLELAEEIALDRGIEVKEVPIKFLVPFLEKCSLEEEDSDLVSRWAELLATAINDFDNKLISYADILAQLGPEEVATLEAMWSHTDPKEMGKAGNLIGIYGGNTLGSNSLSDLHSGSVDETTGVDEHGRYTLLTSKSFYENDHPSENIQTGTYMHEYSVFWLERLGLVKVLSDLNKNYEGTGYFALKAQLTPLGYSFVKACSGPYPNKSKQQGPSAGTR